MTKRRRKQGGKDKNDENVKHWEGVGLGQKRQYEGKTERGTAFKNK